MRMRPGPNGAGLSRKAVFAELDASLKRLGTDYIDLYQIHRWDYDTPISETLEALHDAVRSGKVRYIGASSMYTWQFAKALYLADLNGWTRFVSMQDHYNLRPGHRRDPVEPAGAGQADAGRGHRHGACRDRPGRQDPLPRRGPGSGRARPRDRGQAGSAAGSR